MDTSNGNLPQESEAQRIGHMAGRCLSAAQPDSWRLKPLDGTDDFGLDYQVQTVIGGQVRDIFRLQLKGTTAPELSADGTFFSIQLKASTVRYYEGITEPILLVLCDLSAGTRPAQALHYYCWIEDELRRLNARDLPADQRFVTFRIPKGNQLDPDTDLSEHLEHARAVSKSARAIDALVQAARPEMTESARADLLSRVSGGLEARGFSLLQAIAEPVSSPWPEAPEGSYAWHLREAAAQLRSGDAGSAQVQLDAAGALPGPHSALESAEHAFLQARVHALYGHEHWARDCYESAARTYPRHARYLASWMESELRCRYRDGSPEVDDLISIVNQADQSDPLIKSICSRLLAVAGKVEEGLAIAAGMDGAEGRAAEAIIHTMIGASTEAKVDCDVGLAERSIPEKSQLLFLILRARAHFRLALREWFESESGNVLPISGPSGTDFNLLNAAWNDIDAAIPLLAKQGWPQNIEFIADIWAATATMLGRGSQALPQLLQAARARPNSEVLQLALEALAVSTDELKLALEANRRLPETEERQMHRISLLHMDAQHAQCVELFERCLPNFDQANRAFPNVVASAALSAEKLIRSDLADRWAALLDSRSEWRAQAALLKYFRKVLASPLERDGYIADLIASFDSLNCPTEFGMFVLRELDPADELQAIEFIRVANTVRTTLLLPEELAIKLAHAYVTKEMWSDLLAFSRECISRLASQSKICAFEALALDRLGETHQAIGKLEALLASSTVDQLTLDTYVNIAVRCGMTEDAIRSVETLLARTSQHQRRLECLRLLFGLLHRTDPTDPRCVEVAWRIGGLTNRDKEEEEGLFLVTIISATLYVPLPETDSRLPEMQQRVQEFTQRFPDSNILRTATLQENQSPDELLEMLKRISGHDDSREIWRRNVVTQLSRGIAPVPYGWRPRIVLSHIPDVPTMWEMAKRSSAHQLELHLQMISGSWDQVTTQEIRGRIPLLDLTALQVLHDLELFEHLFQLFPKVAVGQRTLLELAQLCSPMTGSFVREKCLSIQAVLKANVARVAQPLASLEADERRAELLPLEEIKHLAQSPEYTVYSDDALFRIYCCLPEGTKPICTLDVLAALDEGGWLSPKSVAERLAKLCAWHVGVAISVRYQLAALPDALGKAHDVQSGVQALRACAVSSAIFGGIWGGPQSYADLQTTAGQLLRGLIADARNSITSITALMALWHEKSRLRKDAPAPPVRVAIQLIFQAAMLGDKPLMLSETRRLWSVLRSLVENEYGTTMDEQKEQDALAMAGSLAAQYDAAESPTPANSLKGRLLPGLTAGTQDESTFLNAYNKAFIAAATEAIKKR